MAATDIENAGHPPEIIGYAEPWIVAPGDSVAIKVMTLNAYWRDVVLIYLDT